jgi:hypothetical protein
VIEKLRFVHKVIASAPAAQESVPKQISEPAAAAETKPPEAAPKQTDKPAPSGGTAVA